MRKLFNSYTPHHPQAKACQIPCCNPVPVFIYLEVYQFKLSPMNTYISSFKSATPWAAAALDQCITQTPRPRDKSKQTTNMSTWGCGTYYDQPTAAADKSLVRCWWQGWQGVLFKVKCELQTICAVDF
jgi:hypothetical protein